MVFKEVTEHLDYWALVGNHPARKALEVLSKDGYKPHKVVDVVIDIQLNRGRFAQEDKDSAALREAQTLHNLALLSRNFPFLSVVELVDYLERQPLLNPRANTLNQELTVGKEHIVPLAIENTAGKLKLEVELLPFTESTDLSGTKDLIQQYSHLYQNLTVTVNPNHSLTLKAREPLSGKVKVTIRDQRGKTGITVFMVTAK